MVLGVYEVVVGLGEGLGCSWQDSRRNILWALIPQPDKNIFRVGIPIP